MVSRRAGTYSCYVVVKSHLTFYDTVDCGTPGSSVLHYLLEFSQKSISVVSVMLSNHLQGKKQESRENSLILLICRAVITIVGDLLDYYEGKINSTFMALSHTVVLGICYFIPWGASYYVLL